jgi:cation:H+ antiporter
MGTRTVGVWHFVLLVGCAAAIYLSCGWFVNAVEWLGRRWNVGRVAVGTILAAFGTALPESAITLVAVTTGGTAQARDIGVGAAMGGPLALATVAYGATGVALLAHRRKVRAHALVPAGEGNPESEDAGRSAALSDQEAARLAKDQRWFVAVFVVKVVLGLVAFAIKPWLGLLFFAAYAVYFWREMRGHRESGEGERLEPLKLQSHREAPATWAVMVQTLAALSVIFVASQLFVHQLDAIAPMLGLPGAVTALVLSPIATELPETMNAIIWARQGKTGLALANISGAMMIQATVPSGLGLLFTDWRFDGALVWSGIITMIAIAYLLATLRARQLTAARLCVAGGLYLVFAVGLIPLLT